MKKILIVDDEPDFSATVAVYLRGKGYQVLTATNLEAATQLFRRERPRGILLDLNMPILTGDKFLPVIRALEPQLKVIVVTGVTEDEARERFKGTDTFAIFSKGGLSLETLKAAVDEAFL